MTTGHVPSCDCPGRVRPTRRRILQALGVAGATAAIAPALPARLAFGSGSGTDLLVVLSMRGGWDGLSVVPPVGDPNYAQLRPNIGIPKSLAIPLDATFGLHPALAPLKPLWDAGQFAVVHAVGQPSGQRSHFEDSEELERAAPGTDVHTGWLDRAVAARGTGGTFQAMQLGSDALPDALQGPAPAMALNSVDNFALPLGGNVHDAYLATLRAINVDVALPINATSAATLDALATTAALKAAGYTPANGASYPSSPLGQSLRDLARLVKANVGVQVACLDYGNWDMHVGLGRPGDSNGWMHRQLADVAASVSAFATDLGSAWSNVSMVTLTEFGRRAHENGNGGLDHGHGQAVLLLGGGIRGGQVYGGWPGLSPAALDGGDLAGATDYRSILGELLQKRWGLGDLSSVFPNFTPSPLGLARQS